MKSQSSLLVPGAIAAAGIIVAIAVFVTVSKSQPSTSSGTGNPSLVTPVGPNDHILGSPTAVLKIVEYSDYDCSYCKTFHTAIHQIVADHAADGKVAWVYRNYPIVQLHPNTMKHAQAAECVAKLAGNNAYWKFADSLFANQPTNPSRYAELAQAAGADWSAVSTCLQNAASTVDPRIQADMQNAKDVGAQGTPYSLLLVEGRAPIVVPGAVPYDILKQQVDAVLNTLR